MTGDKFEVVTVGFDGKTAAWPVERVIGVDPLRQFLTPAPGGRLQTLEASFDPHKDQWFNVYGNEDRRFGEWGHWTGRGMNWNSMCAACHNTRVRKNYDQTTDTYHTTMAQATVSCESCHGPMKSHVDAKRGLGTPATRPSYKFSKDQILDTCASCHSRRADLTGDFVPGDAYADHYSLSIPDLSDLFYPDGQVKEEDYEFTAFLGSKMHAAGVRCVDCHEPHSSKPIFPGNLLCMRCHNGTFKGAPLIVPETHSFHRPDSPGNQCVNCHMPQTTYMQRHARHDHGFTIPDPLLTRQHQIPNACNRCHTDKDADWSLAAVQKWYGPKMQRPSRQRAQAIARARAGDDSARPAILQMLATEKQPFWRAVAATLLRQWTGSSPDVGRALFAALDDADPLVRENVCRALGTIAEIPVVQQALEKRLADNIRSVRIAAAGPFVPTLDPNSQAGKDLLNYLAVNADQPAGAMQLGSYCATRGDVNTAADYYRKAITWDPNSAPLRDALANALILQGRTRDALEQLDWASKLDPRDPRYPYKAALAHQKLGQLEQARAAAKRALQIAPNFTPASDLLRELGP
jgi:tetratricopeptide (TPR) repeat protein